MYLIIDEWQELCIVKELTDEQFAQAEDGTLLIVNTQTLEVLNLDGTWEKLSDCGLQL